MQTLQSLKCVSLDGKLIQESEKDEIFWEHLDRVVVDEIGMNFEREK